MKPIETALVYRMVSWWVENGTVLLGNIFKANIIQEIYLVIFSFFSMLEYGIIPLPMQKWLFFIQRVPFTIPTG